LADDSWCTPRWRDTDRTDSILRPPAMTIDAEFLKKLVCPRTRVPLRLATAAELAAVNAAVDRNEARTQGGQPVTERVSEGLVPDGEPVLYPVRDGIPVLLIEEGIRTTAAGVRSATRGGKS
jgi:uncharacterized protein YbaR (Trm112 family)